MAICSLIPHLHLPALALAFAPDCSTDGTGFQCHLLSLLHLLYVLGAVLAVILTIVIVFAIRAWQAGRDNQEIPSPKDQHEPHD